MNINHLNSLVRDKNDQNSKKYTPFKNPYQRRAVVTRQPKKQPKNFTSKTAKMFGFAHPKLKKNREKDYLRGNSAFINAFSTMTNPRTADKRMKLNRAQSTAIRRPDAVNYGADGLRRAQTSKKLRFGPGKREVQKEVLKKLKQLENERKQADRMEKVDFKKLNQIYQKTDREGGKVEELRKGAMKLDWAQYKVIGMPRRVRSGKGNLEKDLNLQINQFLHKI